MSNINNLTPDEVFANKGEEQLQIRATDRQMRSLAENLVEEYCHFEYSTEEEFEALVQEHLDDMRKNPHDVGILYTTFDDYDDDDNELGEHEIQISMDIVRMVNKVYADGVLCHEEEVNDDEEYGDFDMFSFDGWYDYFIDYARAYVEEHRDEY